MSGSFASNQKMDSDITLDDDDPAPSPSPETVPYQHSSPTMSMSADSPTRSEGERIDCLVRRMSEQTFRRESLMASAIESRGYEANCNQPANPTNTEPTQVEMRTPPYIPEFSNESRSSHPTSQRPSDLYVTHPLPPPQHLDRIPDRPSDPIMDEAMTPSIVAKDKQNQPEMSLNSRFPTLRRYDLMAKMIDNEDQCNIRISRPATIVPASRIPSSADSEPSAGPSKRSGRPIPFDNNTVLEVDEAICTQPDDEAPSEILGLRDASGPEGIRKLGHLKYRTSLETAMRCKNMRKSAPRMRRRPKPKETPKRDHPIEPASATTPTSSMAT
ncbi:hypothetical protein F4774DRAFT_196927 [Daldinia eschscholtzii]|nr:hypothetical protein F4774DRAFT_196927 [Daldinia eschscholtzii]